MTDSSPEFAELRALLDALCEEVVTDEQMQRLEQLVLAHPAVEAYYVQYMSMHADLSGRFAGVASLSEKSLRARFAGQEAVSGQETGRLRSKRAGGLRLSLSVRRLIWGGLAGLAAGLLVAWSMLGFRPHGDGLSSPESASELLDSGVAVLLQASGAEWEKTEQATRPGTPLSPGWLHLKAGLVQIEFYSGATVILQGPAEFQLISSTKAYCAAGRLRATVPPQAQGFTISTSKLELVDRGTEFGLQVGAGDKTEVHVFQGKVEVYDAGSDRQDATRKELTTGQGVCLDGPGQIHAIKSNPEAFHTARYLEARVAEETRRRQKAWLAGSEAVRRDPSLLVYYTFQTQRPSSRTLLDRASGQQPHDGVIVGCLWGAGRWRGKKGLEFKSVSDRVRLHVPGEFDALTLAAWVRVDALPNRFNSLMMTDGWEEAAPHWHIGSAGKIELGVQGYNRKGGVHYTTPKVFTPEQLGRWTHLAVVYDRDNGRVTHYLDGELIVEQPLQLDIGLRLGDAEIGNWNVGPRHHYQPIRSLNGCIDEFMLFARPLPAEEIQRLFEQGRPPA